ncbi:MAG: DUF5719 family protein [Candidatus Nanopelagicales bacterium]|nr:DUF5719 family protein [Candidatus Nanopelagicales bacterium]
MKRLLTALLIAAAAAGVALVPPLAPDPAGAPARPVRAALLACPELAVSADSASTLAALVVPDGGGTAADGTASLRRIDAALDLARVSAPGDPLTLLVAARSQPPIVLRATEDWAAGAVAGVAVAQRSGPGTGLASAACPLPAPDWWFVGAGSQLGRGAALLVSNPASEPARFDVALFARSGPIEALAGTGIDLAPESAVRLRLDALAQPEELLAVRVRASAGRVAVALRDIAVPRGESPRGVDFIPPAQPPATTLRVGAAPSGPGERVLVLVNPGTQFATVTPRLSTEVGLREIPDLPTIAVPAGSTTSVPLTERLAGQAATVLLSSDVPITAGLRAELPGLRRELSWLSAVPATAAPNRLAAAGAVLVGPGLATTVTVTAPEALVAGTLEVWTTATPGAGILDGPPPADPGTVAADGTLGGPVLVTGPEQASTPVRVTVPAGSLRTVTLPASAVPGLAQVVWRSDPGSGPAVVSHVTRREDPAWQTGYAWWPTLSAVPAIPVREDVGTLAPPG